MTELTRRRFIGSSLGLATGAAVSGVASLASIKLARASQAEPLIYGPKPGVAKLNANENLYGPSKKALQAMFDASTKGAYYVGESVPRLISMIAERNGVTPEHITLSSGSSGVLTYIAVAKLKEGNILGPDLFWDTTTKAALRHGSGELTRIAKSGDTSVDLDALYDAIDDSVSMVQICNPNNPTGMIVDPKALRAFCIKAAKKCTVLVDEAYNEITDDPEANSMMPLVADGHDVIVARTFSKLFGLAGMRVGYMVASPETTELVKRFGLGNYAMNQAGIAGAIASLTDEDFLNYSKSKIVEARDMINQATKQNGLKPLPSQTSFVFVDLGDINAEDFRQKMAEQNVLIRGIYQDYNHLSRVSAGFIKDVQMYVDALSKVLDSLNA
jgi:histidinol-phosphate aminotransferase